MNYVERSIQLKGGYKTADPRLDRLPQFDSRNLKYLAIRGIEDQVPINKVWEINVHLDQGQEGACVGFAFGADALAKPNSVSFVDNKYSREVYKAAQKIDEWEGEEYEGTSTLAGAKVMQKRGFFDRYEWVYTVPELILAVGYKGPALIGVDWYEGMLDTDSNGFIHATGQVLGGHCTLVHEVNIVEGYFRIWNSWSEWWGENGTAKISFEDMALLLQGYGEACIPVNRHNFIEKIET